MALAVMQREIVKSGSLGHLLLEAVHGPDADAQLLGSGVDAGALQQGLPDLLGLVRIEGRTATFLGAAREACADAFRDHGPLEFGEDPMDL